MFISANNGSLAQIREGKVIEGRNVLALDRKAPVNNECPRQDEGDLRASALVMDNNLVSHQYG